MRLLCGLSSAALLAFIGFFLIAAISYPGGNWLDPTANGFDPFRNFWSDLLRERGLDGASNEYGAAFARAGFATIAIGLAAFWGAVSARFERAAVARALELGGALSSVATLAVALLPSDRFPNLHPIAALLAGGVGFACVVVCAGHSLRRFDLRAPQTLLALLLLMAAATNIWLYVGVAYLDRPLTAALPTVQKVATVLLIAWMLAELRAVRARPSR